MIISVTPTIIWDHGSGSYLASVWVNGQVFSAIASTFDQVVSLLGAMITTGSPGDIVQLVIAQTD